MMRAPLMPRSSRSCFEARETVTFTGITDEAPFIVYDRTTLIAPQGTLEAAEPLGIWLRNAQAALLKDRIHIRNRFVGLTDSVAQPIPQRRMGKLFCAPIG